MCTCIIVQYVYVNIKLAIQKDVIEKVNVLHIIKEVVFLCCIGETRNSKFVQNKS